MTKSETSKARLSAAKPNRPYRLAGLALALGSLLLLSLGAQPAFAACGGVTMVGDEAELNAAIETLIGFVRVGLIDALERDWIMAAAAQSQCGK